LDAVFLAWFSFSLLFFFKLGRVLRPFTYQPSIRPELGVAELCPRLFLFPFFLFVSVQGAVTLGLSVYLLN